jgi:hypothetical protein
MSRALLILTFVSPIFFPWPLTACLALASAFYFPLAPLAIGILTDVLYYTHGVAALPWWTFLGALVTLLAFAVRSFFETSIMRQ